MSINNPESQDFVPNNSSPLYNPVVAAQVAKAMSELEPEFDEAYCAEHWYPHFITTPKDEVDLDTVELFTEKSTDIAYQMLHPEYQGE